MSLVVVYACFVFLVVIPDKFEITLEINDTQKGSRSFVKDICKLGSMAKTTVGTTAIITFVRWTLWWV